MHVYFATFGVGHEYSGAFLEIHAANHHCARLFMTKAHGDRWSELYSASEFQGMEARYEMCKLATVIQKAGDHHRDGSPVFTLDWRAR